MTEPEADSTPDELGHVWDGPVVLIYVVEFRTCSRCGCDPSDQRAGWLCEGEK